MSDTGLTSLKLGREVSAENNDYNLGTKELPVFADNAAALAGGLVPGNLYRTGGSDMVKIVHLPEYADNTAALAGGLTAGELYLKTSDSYAVWEVV
jgi:hypothetical protein